MSGTEPSSELFPESLLASVVIPTYNRQDVILKCLEHLECQTVREFEVIVVDDGSTDCTAQLLAQYGTRTPLRFQYVRLENGGPARARNRAIALAVGRICIIIGDDILATETFVAEHIAFHGKHPELEAAGVGLTVWSETEQTVTPLMRWMETGFQFDYDNLRSGTPPEWWHFYTSNLSAKTELLRDNPFDERFQKAIMEDVELGYRLQTQRGLRLVFLPDAVAEHVHPITLEKACSRAYEIGRVASFFDRLWPEAHGKKPAWRLALRKCAGSGAWALPLLRNVTGAVTRVWCPNPLLKPLLSLHLAAGRRAADVEAT